MLGIDFGSTIRSAVCCHRTRFEFTI